MLAVAVALTSISSISVEVKPKANGTMSRLILRVKTRSGAETITREINSGPGSGPAKGWVLGDGKTAVVRMHLMNRTNVLVGAMVNGGKLVIDQDLSEHLYGKLPKTFRDKTISDCIGYIKFAKRGMMVDFKTRNLTDGVNAWFARSKGGWVFRTARYWRDPNWNGIRNF